MKDMSLIFVGKFRELISMKSIYSMNNSILFYKGFFVLHWLKMKAFCSEKNETYPSAYQPNEYSVRQYPVRLGFNPWSTHSKYSKSGTWCLLA